MTADHMIPRHGAVTRRGFVARSLALLGAAVGGALAPGADRRSGTRGRRPDHPDPRPGIDASNVLSGDALADAPNAVPVYEGVREMPHIADGLRCYCGCAEWDGYRSLLTCFEDSGMAMYCDGCLAEAELAHRRWKEGQSLAQIRRAVDARFAPPAS